MKGETKMPAYRVVMWNEGNGMISEPQTAVFKNETDAQIYEQIWRNQGHIVRCCGSEEDYNYPLYNMNENSVFLIRRSARPFSDDPERKGELVYHQLVYGIFGVLNDNSEYGFAGVVYQNGKYIPFDDLQEVIPEEVPYWEDTIRNCGEWF